ncbi:MAG: metal-dependent hydrolase [Gemmatimonadota bacterium]
MAAGRVQQLSPVQTYSHLLASALVGERLRRRTRVRLKAFLVGSVLPDLPLLLLTAWFFWSEARPGAGGGPAFGPAYDQLYFHDPVWIISTSLFHAPLLIAALVLIGQRARGKGRSWGGSLLWLGLGCGLHTLLDIPTHHHDGPLLFFPFDWSYRFPAPVSYWDPEFGAAVVAPVEHAVDAAILVYFVWLLLLRYRRKRRRFASVGNDEHTGRLP